MKKIILIAVAAFLLLTCPNAFSQSMSLKNRDVQFGVIGGLNIAKTSTQVFGSSLVGFHAGVQAELPVLIENAYVSSGIFLSQKGFNAVDIDFYNDKVIGGVRAPILYLSIPIHIGYKYPFTESLAGFIDGGLFAAYAISVDEYWEELEPRRFDFGLGAKIGVEFNQKYRLSLGYDLGLISFIDFMSVNNRTLMISLGLMF